MIVLRAVRVEESGAETELGEVRLTEVGQVYSHLATAEGGGVVRDLVERMRVATPEAVRQSRSTAAPFPRRTNGVPQRTPRACCGARCSGPCGCRA